MSLSPCKVQHTNVAWFRCNHCEEVGIYFESQGQFVRHLRESHCSREGGSFVCHYGYNAVCNSLPLEGVSDQDYEQHVLRQHVFAAHIKNANMSNSQLDWTHSSSTQNLPAVLNDPNRVKPKDFFTKTWGQDFTEKAVISPSPFLSVITANHFEYYRRKISKRFQKHLDRKAVLTKKSIVESHPKLQVNLAAVKETYDQIPEIFFRKDLDLSDPEVFSTVFPFVNDLVTTVNANDAGGSLPNSSRIFHEQLSHNLDIIEVNIAQQIADKAEAFFHAMSSHDALMVELSNTLSSLRQLRKHIHQIDNVLVRDSFKILKLRKLRQNYFSIFSKLRLMSTVQQTQPTIQLLLSTSEFVGALDLIETTQEVLKQELPDVHSFRHLGSQLSEMSHLIDKMLNIDLVKCLTSELNRPLTDLIPVTEDERLVAIVLGMMKQQQFSFTGILLEEINITIKAVIKQTVIEVVVNSDMKDETFSLDSFVDRICRLDPEKYISFYSVLCDRMKVLLVRIQAIQGIIRQAVDAAYPDKSDDTGSNMRLSFCEDENLKVLTHEEYKKISGEVDKIVSSSVDAIHERLARFLISRGKDLGIDKFSPSHFVSITKVIENFVEICGRDFNRKCKTLFIALQGQATKFVSRFHGEKRSKLILLLTNERWKQTDVPPTFQELLHNIAVNGKFSMNSKELKNKEVKKSACFEEEEYTIAGVVLLLLQMLSDYLAVVSEAPILTPELTSRIVDLLMLWNSYVFQQLLGAQALRTAGLRTITLRNLALGLRSLQLIQAVLPYLKQELSLWDSDKPCSGLKQLDQVAQDMGAHGNQIREKLVSIVIEGIDNQLSQWNARPPVPSATFRSISKTIGKFHEATSDIFSKPQIKTMFNQINQGFTSLMRKYLVSLNVPNDGGPQHGVVTSELTFYKLHIKGLIGEDISCDIIEEVWRR